LRPEPLPREEAQFRISCDVAVASDAENIVNFVDLFSGAGGLSLGLGYAGMTPMAALDSWLPAVSVYNENVGQHAFTADLGRPQTLVPAIARLMPDLIAGGPPCQDYSAAGNRREGARASLTVAFAETIVALKPRWFVFENVPGASGSNAYRKARTHFGRAGYGLTEIILDASECGVPHPGPTATAAPLIVNSSVPSSRRNRLSAR
jgi:DNA (cytosine-5)-methyltransferase 1